MILTNFLVGLPMTLACLIIQVLVANGCMHYYTSRKFSTSGRFIASVQPILVTMLAMMFANFVQVILWGILFVFLVSSPNTTRPCITPASISPH